MELEQFKAIIKRADSADVGYHIQVYLRNGTWFRGAYFESIEQMCGCIGIELAEGEEIYVPLDEVVAALLIF